MHDVGEGRATRGVTMSTYFLGSIGDALVNFMVKPIGAIFVLLLLLPLLCRQRLHLKMTCGRT